MENCDTPLVMTRRKEYCACVEQASTHFQSYSMTTITTEGITGKKEELAKKIKYHTEKLEECRKDLEALERTERLLTGVSETATDKKRKEIGDAVLRALPDMQPVHYRVISEKVSTDLGKEIKQNAMYNFLNRAIERAELPIQKMEEGQYARTKGAEDDQRVEAAPLQE